MARRLGRIYLWVALAATFALGFVREAAGTEVFIPLCTAHLALVAAAVWAAGAAKGSEGRAAEHPAFLPGVLLIAGPMILFVGATTGPPAPARPGDYLFNSTSLLLGVVVVLIGYAALSARLWQRRERTWSVLGLAGLLVGVALYGLNMIFRLAHVASGAAATFAKAELQVFPGLGNIAFPLSAEPAWPVFLYVWATLMLAAYAILAYLASASYGAALMRVGWVGKLGGRVFVTLGLALSLVMGAGWLFLSNPVVQTALFFLGVPFMSVVLPYFVGVVLLGDAGAPQRADAIHVGAGREPVRRSDITERSEVFSKERNER